LNEWTTSDSRSTPSTTNLEEEEIVDALGNDGKALMPKQVNRPNAWRKMMMMMMTTMMSIWARNVFRTWKCVLMIARKLPQFLPYPCYCCIQEWLPISATLDLFVN